MKTVLLAIDAQVDFCDPSGALSVAGAADDMARAAVWLAREGQNVDAVVATLDSHHLVDIAHPLWWRDENGQPPAPFTQISAEDVRAGRFRVSDPARHDRSLAYVEHLAETGHKVLMVWPPHCLLGHPGHAVFPVLRDAFDAWETQALRPVDYIIKGLNPFTEHYSAVRAEMEDPADPDTGVNHSLIDLLKPYDRIVVIGEAQSHCVADTVTDLTEFIPAARFTLLTDAMSCVAGFEETGRAFHTRIAGQGAQLATTI